MDMLQAALFSNLLTLSEQRRTADEAASRRDERAALETPAKSVSPRTSFARLRAWLAALGPEEACDCRQHGFGWMTQPPDGRRTSGA